MLPDDPKARKRIPLATGLLDYFPDAMAAVAELSLVGNEQHNPGEPLHWAREKSADHDDCLLRHFVARGTIDGDGIRHSAKVAWRALALLQLEVEAAVRGEPQRMRLPPAYDAHPGARPFDPQVDTKLAWAEPQGGVITGRPGPVPHNPVSQSTGD